MRLTSYILFSSLVLAAFGCTQKTVDEYTAQLDSAMVVVENAQLTAQLVDKENLEKIGVVYASYVKFYSEEYDDLSDTSFHMNELSDMAICNKYVNRTAMNIDGWRKELDVTYNQLQNLKHDYENGLIDSVDMQSYLSSELFATYEINKDMEKNIGQALSCEDNFKVLTDVLDSVRVQWLERNATNE